MFADGIAVIAQDEINLKRALGSLGNILKSNYTMKTNRKKKQKLMVCSKDPENINIKMDDDILKQIPKFKNLGRICTEDGKNKEDIIQRIREAKVMINNNKKQLLFSNNLSLEIKQTYKKLCLECCSLWIRNMDRRRK
jgi:hypothetical protein